MEFKVFGLEGVEEDQESQKDRETIAEKKGLDNVYQAMKYLDKKGNRHPLERYTKIDQ